jgi:hypothetical protein
VIKLLTEEKVTKEEELWEKEKALIERENKLKQEKKQAKGGRRIPTTKLLIAFLFLNCTIIELFTGWITLKSLDIALITETTPDFSPLISLIGSVVGEVIGFAVYAIKSAKENTESGIVYMKAKYELEQNLNNSEETQDEEESVG